MRQFAAQLGDQRGERRVELAEVGVELARRGTRPDRGLDRLRLRGQPLGADTAGNPPERMRQAFGQSTVVGAQRLLDLPFCRVVTLGKPAQQSDIFGDIAHHSPQSGRRIETADRRQRRRRGGRFRRPGVRDIAADPAGERSAQYLRLDRLGDMVVHAGCQNAGAVFDHRVGRHGNDRQRTVPRRPADRPGGREAVHDRHLHVHQHRGVIIRVAAQDLVDRDRTVRRQLDREAELAEQTQCHLLVQLVVLDEEDATTAPRLGSARCGSDNRLRLGPRPAFGIVQGMADDVEQQRRRERLRQQVFDPDLPGFIGHFLAPLADHQDDARRRIEPQRIDLRRRLEAVEIHHLGVEEYQRERLIGGSRSGDRGDRFPSGPRRSGREAHTAQHSADDVPGTGMIVNDEDRQTAQIGLGHHDVSGRGFPEPGGKPEGAADALGAVNADRATHRLGKRLADDKAKARPAVSPGNRGVRLLEGLKQPRTLRLAEPHSGIARAAIEQHLTRALFAHFNNQLDLALFGKLDGVGHVIDEDLTEPQRIADQAEIQPWIDVEDKFEPFRGGLAADQVGDPVQDLVGIELGVFEDKLPRLELRKIEDVIDDLEQHLRGLLDLRQGAALVGGQAGFEQ